MKKSRKKKAPKQQGKMNMNSLVKRFIIADTAGLISVFILLSLFSLFLMKQNVSKTVTAAMVLFAFALSAFIVGFSAVRPVRKSGIVLGAAANIPFLIFSLILLLAAAGGKPSLMILAVVAVIAVFGVLGGIAAVNLRKKVRR